MTAYEVIKRMLWAVVAAKAVVLINHVPSMAYLFDEKSSSTGFIGVGHGFSRV